MQPLKLLTKLSIILLIPTLAFAQPRGSSSGVPSGKGIVQIDDGTTTALPYAVTFSGASVADDRDGTATVTITGGAGDSITVNSTAVDTTANFLDGTDITWTLADGGAGGPDDITGTVVDDSHNHVYSNIDPFTEANLYTILSDVSDFVQGGEANSIDSDMYVDDSIDDAHLDWANLTTPTLSYVCGKGASYAGTITVDGVTMDANEVITLGGQEFDHDGTDFVLNDDLTISAAGPDLSLVPTTGDTFGYHVEPSMSQAWLSNETDGVHYIFFDSDHTMRFGRTGNVPAYIFGSGAVDTGEATSFELPNLASPTVDKTGEIALDTSFTDPQNMGLPIVYDGKQVIYVVATTDLPGDNEVPKYDNATGFITWEADAGAGGASEINVILRPQAAKLPTSAMAVIDAGNSGWRLLFDDTTQEFAAWEFILDDDYGSGTLYADVYFSMASGESDEVEFEGYVMAYTPATDSADWDTDSYDTVNEGTATTVAASAGRVYKQTITLTNADSAAAGDIVRFKLSTDSDDATNDDATGDREVRLVVIRE